MGHLESGDQRQILAINFSSDLALHGSNYSQSSFADVEDSKQVGALDQLESWHRPVHHAWNRAHFGPRSVLLPVPVPLISFTHQRHTLPFSSLGSQSAGVPDPWMDFAKHTWALWRIKRGMGPLLRDTFQCWRLSLQQSGSTSLDWRRLHRPHISCKFIFNHHQLCKHSQHHRLAQTSMEVENPIKGEIIYLARWQKENLIMGQLAQERLDRPQYLPALLQRRRNSATFIYTLSYCEKSVAQNQTWPRPHIVLARDTHLNLLRRQLEFKRACSQVFTSRGYLAYLAGPKQFDFWKHYTIQ